MARLIDADKLIDFIDVGHLRHPGELCYSEVDVANLLLHAPTVDAVEVVRCEFCKNAEPYDCTFHGTVHHLYKCKKDEGVIGYNKVVLSKGFCSYGERKDNV